MKILGRDVKLSILRPAGQSTTLARQPKPKNLDKQIGTGGDGQYYFKGEKIQFGSSPKAKDFVKMRQNDGTASSLYNILTLPILSNDWRLENDPDDVLKKGKEESYPQADFIENCFRLPEHKGGMSTPFSLVLAEMLRATIEGYRFFEIVLKLNDSQQVVLKKLAGYEPDTLTLLRDGRGGFNGAKQRAFIDGKYEEVVIQVQDSFLFTYGKEKNNIEGESAFLPGYYHYDKKHRLYYLFNQAAQASAIGMKVGKAPEGSTPEERDTNLAEIDKMGVRPSIMLPDGYELDIKDLAGKFDIMKGIDHHNAEMARSVLAQFLMLGTSSGDVGSYALSQSHSDVFIMALRGLMTNIEEHINAYLIPKLIDYNFDKPMYPTFKFNDLTNATKELMRTVFTEIVSKRPDGLPDYIIEGIADRVAEELEIEKPSEEELAAAEQKKADAAAAAAAKNFADNPGDAGNPNPDNAPPPDGGNNTPPNDGKQTQSRQKKGVNLADAKWFRPLTPTERKVNFAGLQKKADTLEEQFISDTKPIYDKIRADALKRLDPILQAKDLKALDSFELRFGDELTNAILREMNDAYVYAKQGASDEIGVRIPSTPTQTRDIIKQKAQAIAGKQLSDLLFAIKTAVTEAVRKNQLNKSELSVGDVLATITGLFGTFFEDKSSLTAAAVISGAINIGRNDVFESNKNKIQSYQYSAILDATVCPICADLDGTVVDEAQYRSTQWMPPIHFNCRCIWVAIMADEDDPPEIGSFPDAPGGTTQPTLARTYHLGLYLSKEHSHGS